MLEFYACPYPLLMTAASRPLHASACVLVLALLAGCAGLQRAPEAPATPAAPPTAPPLPRNAEPPPPAVNLAGFPLPYRQGYADGCASIDGVERKDAARFAADGNYRTGWQDGLWQCKKKR